MDRQRMNVLLVDDDEDDYLFIKSLLCEAGSSKFNLTWAGSYEAALDELSGNRYDICVIDYMLGDRTGLELLEKAKERGLNIPAILLTGYGDYEIDFRAMKAGAADFLEKGALTTTLLDRSLRYAVEHARINGLLQHLSRKILFAQEEERESIAKDLHDRVASSLAAIKFGIERKLEDITKGKESLKESGLEDLIPLIQSTIREVKRMQNDLRPPIIDDLGIGVSLNSLCREFGNTYPSIRIEPSVQIREEDIPGYLKLVIYRIAQEALSNIGKHSRASDARVSLSVEGDRLEFVIQDNGNGFDSEAVLQGGSDGGALGVESMRARTQYSGGIFSLASGKGRGTTIRMTWPAGVMT